MKPEHGESGGETERPDAPSMAATSRGTEHYDGKLDSPSPERPKEDDFENLKFPQPWKFEKWLPGGYNQKRMLKFKNPKTMYYAINLFAGMMWTLPKVVRSPCSPPVL